MTVALKEDCSGFGRHQLPATSTMHPPKLHQLPFKSARGTVHGQKDRQSRFGLPIELGTVFLALSYSGSIQSK